MGAPTTIFVSDGGVRIVRTRTSEVVSAAVETSGFSPTTELAQRIAELTPATNKPVTLVVPASWCYLQRFRVPQRRPKSETLRFAFEEFLPIDIESLTCDFMPMAPGEYLGIGVETEVFRSFLTALDDGGLTVGRLAIATPDTTEAAIWIDQRHFLVCRPEGDTPQYLRAARIAPNGVAPAQHVAALLNGDLADAESIQIFGELEASQLHTLAETLSGQVAERPRAQRLLPVNLGSGELEPAGRALQRSLVRRNLAVLTCMLLIALVAASLIRRTQLNNRLEEIQRWEQDQFAQVFPNQPIPAGIARRVASERKRLEGLTLADADSDVVQTDAIRLLQQVVAALPPKIKVNLQEIRIDGSNILVRGQTTDHRAAERIAQRIDAIPGLDCPNPRTDRVQGGIVQFVLSATVSSGSQP